jgi:hypothetical protein
MSEKKQHPWTLPRVHPRFLLDIRILIRGKQVLHGRTKDIAEGGLGATVAGDIQVGDIVELEFQLPEAQEPMKVKAEVRYRQGFQCGVKFLNATSEQRDHIRKTTMGLRPAL